MNAHSGSSGSSLNITPTPDLAGVVLAAGSSSRLGQPKQLLRWRGTELVNHAVDHCAAVCGAGVVVVTGACAERVAEVLTANSAAITFNPDWQDGLASSLLCGLQFWQRQAVRGVLVLHSDQALLTSADLQSLASCWLTAPDSPAAALYSGVAGVPVIFPRSEIDGLTNLSGDSGARDYLLHSPDLNTIAMPNAAFDVDTEEDLRQLRQQ